MKKSVFLLLSVFVFAPVGAQANPALEVVESVPIETTLTVPGIRSTQEVWLEMIQNAKSSIDIEEFYINSEAGQSLEPVLSALKAAAGRGVQVRILVDSNYYKNYSVEPDSLAQVQNIAVKQIDFSQSNGIMHAKYFVVDRSVSYAGSANFDWLALTHIHEIGLKVADSKAASDMEAVFEKDWGAGQSLLSKSPGPAAPQVLSVSSVSKVEPNDTDGTFFVVASPAAEAPAGVADTLANLTRLMDGAKHTLKIQVYEYTTSVYKSSQTWKVLDQAIRRAAARGVQVQLMTDSVALKAGKKDLVALSSVQNVKVQVVTIPQWSGGPIPYARLIHSKYAVADGADSWVGSENWEGSYFEGSRNVGLIVHAADISSQLGAIFDTVWSSPYSRAP